jgi:hypothetical protein
MVLVEELGDCGELVVGSTESMFMQQNRNRLKKQQHK